MKRIILFGPGPRFKGGLANYTTSLARALDALPGTEVHIISWTQQYPAIIPRDYIDRASRTDLLEGTRIRVHYLTNYNNPFTWTKTAAFIASLHPALVVFQWSIALQGLPLGCMVRSLRRRCKAEIIFDLHFVVQKEESRIDRLFTRLGISGADTYIVHAMKTAYELQELFPEKRFALTETGKRAAAGSHTLIKLYHPVYDMYKPEPDLDVERVKRELNLRKHVFLFFGFIRKYKGLHHCIRAFARVREKRDDVSLLIVGESFWDTLDSRKFSTRLRRLLFGAAKSLFLPRASGENHYRPLQLIEELGLKESVTLVNRYVPHEEVHRYFQVSDCILLFYEFATPSGVESMAYNFALPILATRVGHFPETVKDGFNGYLAEPENVKSMAAAMEKSIKQPIPADNVRHTASEMTWEKYARAILGTMLGGRGGGDSE